MKCRGCPECKNGGKIEYISIQEEVEQCLIEKSVKIDLNAGHTIASLPFLSDPIKKLASNKHIALKIYRNQVKKLNQNPADKNDVIESENKLQNLGLVDYLDNLSVEQRNKIKGSPINYFIPWRAVWNLNSQTTQCRLVFDASHPTDTGVSLNNILAKGRNGMNKLIEIAIRWQMRRYGFHTDVSKMYNSVKLIEDHWCYQLYLWEEGLGPLKIPREKVIPTIIYGVVPSGNQAEQGIRQIGNLMKNDYPRINEVIQGDIYVDDCPSGENTKSEVNATADNLKLVLGKGGFNLKGFTFSGSDPPEHLANDDSSVNVFGMKWFSKEDKLSLNIKKLNFGKKCRGKKSQSFEGLVPEKFT